MERPLIGDSEPRCGRSVGIIIVYFIAFGDSVRSTTCIACLAHALSHAGSERSGVHRTVGERSGSRRRSSGENGGIARILLHRNTREQI